MPSVAILVIVATVLISLLVLAWSILRHKRGHGPRALVRSLGVVAFLVGLYLSGLSTLAANGIRSIYDWAQHTQMTQLMQIGFGVLGFGVLLFLIGTLIRPRTREQAKAVRAQRRGAVAPGASAPAVRSAGGTSSGSEDDEVEAILKNRGIN